MITTETLLPFWTTIFAVIGGFFGVRAFIRRKKQARKKDNENKNPENKQ